LSNTITLDRKAFVSRRARARIARDRGKILAEIGLIIRLVIVLREARQEHARGVD
jgi:hypothetical protein